MNGALLGFNNKEVDEMYDDIVGFAELERFMDQKLKNYSSGMQVRLAFSIAIRARSDILVLDEVLAVGDAAFQQKCFDYFEILKKQGQTVVLVTHDMSAVERFCKRAMLIEKGEIKVMGVPGVVADTYREDNITSVSKNEQSEAKIQKYRLEVGIDDQAGDERVIKFTHNYPSPKDVYIGFTLFRDGMNVAELNNSKVEHSGGGEVLYVLDTDVLNPGVYEVSAVLFTKKNKAPVAICLERKKFVVKGSDITRGSALKLNHSWE
jgi:ABC-2 type transport system ATP-binding protein